MNESTLGIERIQIYPSTLMLSIEALCAARGLDYEQVSRTVMNRQRSVIPPWEDTVTLAVNAASGMLSAAEAQSVALLIVATESSVDQEKPVSSWVHRWLGLSSGCRNFEVKHACYGATASMRMALAWLREQDDPGCRALIVSADASLIGFNEPYEPVMGACGAAVLLGSNPATLEIDPRRWGVYAQEVADVIRPALGVETGNSDTSLFSYLEALEGAYEDYRRRTGGELDFERDFARHIYHLPFPGMGLRAHRALAAQAAGLSRATATASYSRKVEPSLRYGCRIGSTYSGSTYVALLSHLDHDEGPQAGDRISVFSYGSGSCAEFYVARVGAEARAGARRADLQSLLDCRHEVSVSEYERCERSRVAAFGASDFHPDFESLEGHYDRHYRGTGRLVLDNIEGYYREYRRA